MKKATVVVKLKTGILDPKGQAINNAIKSLGHDNIKDVRQGKYFEIQFESKGDEEDRKTFESLGEQLLSNPVIENYTLEIE